MPLNKFILDETILEGITSPNLYYPNSGMDLMDAISLFSPYISEFYFVDMSYFAYRSWVSAMCKPADEIAPLLSHRDNYRLLGVEFSEGPMQADVEWRSDPVTGESYRWVEPCTRSERYVHIPSEREIVVHRRRGFGVSGLKKLIDQLGVFYYRGDSSEGSNTAWLSIHGYLHKKGKRYPFDEVLDRIVDKGLVVTDGSWCHYGEYLEFARAPQGGSRDILQTIADAASFTDSRGFSYRCVGYAGRSAGRPASLIWQVRRPESS